MSLKIVSFLAVIFSGLTAVAQAAPPDDTPNGQPFVILLQQIQNLSLAQQALANRVSTLEGSVADLQSDLGEAEDTIAALRADLAAANDRIADLQANPVLDLGGVLALDNSSGYTTVVLSGANLQVVNGTGVTDSVNGLGNVIVGYNAPGFFLEDDPDGDVEYCSDGQYVTQTECELNGAVWANTHKSGSHNLIVGDHHNYSQYVGLAVGENNAIRAPNSVASGGRRNQVTREFASISGGRDNYASAFFATVSGGWLNTASGRFAHVSGGENNEATEQSSSVSGGEGNTASGRWSSILGGQNQSTAVDYDTIPALP